MEDKSITNQESLDLIARMIRNSRQNIEPGDGSPFLIWGYTTFFISLAVWLTWKLTGSPDARWIWFAIPIVGGIWSWLANRNKPKQIRTFIDRVIGIVWATLGACTVGTALCAMFVSAIPVLTIIAMLMFAGQAITGSIIRLKYIQYMGFAGILLSFGLLLLPGNLSIFGFALLFAVIMVIPGHMMNYGAKKQAKQGTAGHV